MGKTQLTITASEGDAACLPSELKSSLKSSCGRDVLWEGSRWAGKLPTGIATQSSGFTFCLLVSHPSVVTTYIRSTIHGKSRLGQVILFWSAVDISLRFWKMKTTNQTHSVFQIWYPLLFTETTSKLDYSVFTISINGSAPSTGTKCFFSFFVLL